MPAVMLSNLTKQFDRQRPALHNLTLDVAPGEFLVLLGPSGCGKTTVLRLIAGLEEPTAGDIVIDGLRVNDVPPRARDVAMVFQSYALYPHLTVRENIAFPLVMRRVAKGEVASRVTAVAETLGLGPLLDRRPAQLSGGERQRVALGRAIVRQPKVFLFDEPLSNLDAKLRVEMRAELVRLHRRLTATMVYVTHDQVEAMTMGQRIAVLHEGELMQVGTPSAIYGTPANVFVATFIGAPGMNILDAPTHRRADAPTRGETPGRLQAQLLGFRPEDARLASPEDGEFCGTVSLVEPLGAEALVHVRLASGQSVVCRVRDAALPAVDAAVGIRVAWEKLHRFDAVTGLRVR